MNIYYWYNKVFKDNKNSLNHYRFTKTFTTVKSYNINSLWITMDKIAIEKKNKYQSSKIAVCRHFNP